MPEGTKNRAYSRRRFVKNLAAGAAAVVSGIPQSVLKSSGEDYHIKKGEMYYRRLGRTGFLISEISLGGSPLPDWSLLLQIIERGVNYIDTSHTYNNGNSERQIGRLFKEIGRDKVYVCTKFHAEGRYTEKSIIESVEGSLRRLGTDVIDVLSIHGAENEADLTDQRVLGAFEKLKAAGKYKFRGLSCHSNHQRVIKTAVENGLYDVVQLGYNVFDIQEGETNVKTYEDYLGQSGIRDLIAFAKAKDVGVIAMKTLRVGGRRQDLANYKTGTTSIFQAMLKWVLENKNLTAVVTEMLNYDQMREDLAAVGSPLSAAERKSLFLHVAEHAKDYCHMCGTCQKTCPSRIRTTDILRYLAYAESYGKTASAKAMYAQLAPEQTALACRDCGGCQKQCFYGVDVRKRIADAHRILRG
jgi:predicted aldo/keto reductase-like oxidoreductase